ncbi:nitrogen assimilation transcription factor nirA [Colletotrichum spaethianum]|uniref:Nitrogen assimilation transcription factor nirA n=1 Tax=Colletotrichum spaethianum TaxID=700344 RepID=A0AA37LB01_9PEZI|nr:nitrogen assimilation transcription factor nirA [Colletotrichum spaethianum]GKT41037.1 nitrogen assimilation transcription factor nirA [Colletotrichum spaethianum]
MAHNLGLHLDCSKWTTAGMVSEEEAEARKVTWLFATGLGRPSSTTKSTITCPKPSIDTTEEYTPWLPTSDSPYGEKSLGVHSHISSTACHVSEIMTIACEAMDVIYAANSKLSVREIEDVVSKTDVELRTHYRELPSYLRLPASPKAPMLPHVCLFQPLVHKKKRRSVVSVNASSEDGGDENDEYVNQHMAICRDSATEIAKLLRIYKQQYTLRRIPIAAVHLCFSATVIHLIDARPRNPNRQQAIRHLQTCIDALRDLRTAWWTWSDRALRAVRLLAREWYQCEDVSQLQHWSGLRVETANGLSGDCDITDGAVRGGQRTRLGPFGESRDQETGGRASTESDTLAFLFDVATPDQYTDSLVKEWLAESGYDVLNTIVE